MRIKKKHKKILMYALIVIGILFMAKFSGFLTIFYGVNEIKCSKSDIGILTCSAVGSGRIGDARIKEGTIQFSLDDSSGFYVSNFYSVFSEVLSKDNSDANDFFSINTGCGNVGGRLKHNIIDNNQQKWSGEDFLDVTIEPGSGDCTAPMYVISADNLVEKHFKNQLMIVEGYITDNEDVNINQVQFKTYGFCDMYNGICLIKEPVIMEQYDERFAKTISSIKIYLKTDGFKDDFYLCNTYNVNCEPSPTPTINPTPTPTPSPTPTLSPSPSPTPPQPPVNYITLILIIGGFIAVIIFLIWLLKKYGK